MQSSPNMKSGILTGTTFALVPNLHWSDALRTVVLACIGAIVSAVVSFLIQQLKLWLKKKSLNDI